VKDTVVYEDYQLVIRFSFQEPDNIGARQMAQAILLSIGSDGSGPRIKIDKKLQRIFKNKAPENVEL